MNVNKIKILMSLREAKRAVLNGTFLETSLRIESDKKLFHNQHKSACIEFKFKQINRTWKGTRATGSSAAVVRRIYNCNFLDF
jgi:hypothetical protein